MRNEKNTTIYLTIISVAALYALGTFLHDPVMHGIVAYLNGWQIESYSHGLMIGTTTAVLTSASLAKSPVLNIWLYYMFPALFIITGATILALLRPIRWVIVAGIILISLNLASLNPEIPGSDASSAAKLLASRGWSEPAALGLQYILFFLILAIWGLYLYVAIENSPKDARRRIRNIWS